MKNKQFYLDCQLISYKKDSIKYVYYKMPIEIHIYGNFSPIWWFVELYNVWKDFLLKQIRIYSESTAFVILVRRISEQNDIGIFTLVRLCTYVAQPLSRTRREQKKEDSMCKCAVFFLFTFSSVLAGIALCVHGFTIVNKAISVVYIFTSTFNKNDKSCFIWVSNLNDFVPVYNANAKLTVMNLTCDECFD